MHIYFESYGCTLNSGEERMMRDTATASGHTIAREPEDADMIVILTCTVIEPTEHKMKRRIDQFKDMGNQLVVSGCMANVQADMIKDIAPEAVLLPTPGQVTAFSEFIQGQNAEADVKTDIDMHLTDVSIAVPIAEGCTGHCTYCITRFARGILNSYPMENIVEDVKKAVNQGAFEIRITASDTASYGLDSYDEHKLPDLLKELCSIDSDLKIRVGMMNPNSLLPVLDEMIEIYKHPKIFKFLHLPVQSGSDYILRSMGRKYEVNDFKSIVEKFREEIPDLTLSTDIIVGFPGEREADFRSTIFLLNNIRPNIVNITRFSERPGTPASLMQDKLHGRTIKARSRELTAICQSISTKLNEELIGQEFTVLATEADIGKHVKTTLARTEAYRPVVIDEELELGKRYEVRIEAGNEAYVVGRIL